MAKNLEVINAEIAQREAEYQNAIDAAIRLLQDAKTRKPSTHVGHNLGSAANELSVIAGKIDANQAVVRFLESSEGSK